MARMKLTVRKHVHAPPRRNVVPTESHNDGQNVGYLLRTLWTVILALGYSESPLFISVLRLLRGNSCIWHVHMIIYERPMIDHIHRIRHVVEATTPRWTFEGGVREAPVENGPQELDDLDDLDDLDEGHSDMDEWFPQDGSND
jgi:hypothetical protein